MANKWLDLNEIGINADYQLNCLKGTLLQLATLSDDNGLVGLKEDGTLFFRQNGISYGFIADDTSQDKILRSHLDQGWIPLAVPQKMSLDDEQVIYLNVYFFSKLKFLSDMRLIFSDRLIQQLQKDRKIANIKAKEALVEELNKFLQSFYMQDPNNSNKGLIVYIKTKERVTAAVAKTETDADAVARPGWLEAIMASKKRPEQVIELFSKDGGLQVEVYKQNKDVLAVATRWISGRQHINNLYVPLSIGNCQLTATLDKEYSSAAVRASAEQKNTYVELWRQYAHKEGDFLLQRNRAIGLLGYRDTVKYATDNGEELLVVTLKDSSLGKLNLLKVGDNLQTADSLPLFLAYEDDNWDEYQERIEAQNAGNRRRHDLRRYRIKAISKEKKELRLKPLFDAKIDKISGHLFCDDIGDQKQIERRQKAQETIENGKVRPHFSSIINGSADPYTEDMRIIPQKAKRRKTITLSDRVCKKVFHYPPTSTQRRAIEIALNTPDIAIIQGPPGTGKTTVILAILERLNELADKKKIQRGQVLITSLQHDAVRNVIERISINSLPTIKFGSRQDEEESMDNVVDDWCNKLAKRIREKNPELKENEEAVRLAEAFDLYNINPTTERAVEFLDTALSVECLDGDLIAQLEKKRREYNKKIKYRQSDAIINEIRRLQTQPASFADGGAAAADTVLVRLENLLTHEDNEDAEILDTLDEAASTTGQASKELLRRLSQCKRKLLERCITPPRYEREVFDDTLTDLYEQVNKGIRADSNKENKILCQLLDALDNNAEEIRDTLKSYCFAYAATAQQSLGSEIKLAKADKMEYDTVIVDEAARVNPGDLMIPLSQAKERIILVGDHRQLPHMYDEEIFEALAKENMPINTDDIKESMFEYLLKRAKQLTAEDNIPRFVTLDNQFRMHKDLGNFISQNFYACHDVHEAFKSPRPDEDFAQPLEPAPMKWINLPKACGNMITEGHSHWRSCEVDIIVKKIMSYYPELKKEHLTVGVISFYRAQVKHIKNALEQKGLSDMVRVGTVDAFQGMEFDIIFLSMVRTGIKATKAEIAELERNEEQFAEGKARERFRQQKNAAGLAQYGFLTSENRLCVALSRQKRLLIVVGDGDLVHSDLGKRLANLYVPALKNFYELCEAKGMVENV